MKMMEGFQPFDLKGKREGCPSFNNLGNLHGREWHSRGRGFDSHQLHSKINYTFIPLFSANFKSDGNRPLGVSCMSNFGGSGKGSLSV